VTIFRPAHVCRKDTVYSIASGLAQRRVEKGQRPQLDGLVKALEQDLQSLGAAALPIRS